PGHVPFLHPGDNKATICDLCNGDPQCVKVCREGGWNALNAVERILAHSYKFYAKKPSELAKELTLSIYGKCMEEIL
ncbi:MAG: 4Fe-4S dicluster domain-containing protein, partial [Nitrososphaeria archaeon]